MADFTIFSQRLRELRQKMQLTQKDFATSVGTTSVTLSAYENNSKKPSLDIVKEIAQKYNVSIDWLCGMDSVLPSTDKKKATYSDIIKMIISIYSIEDLEVELSSEPSDKAKTFVDETKELGCLKFNNSQITGFMSEWKDMLNLVERGTITPHLYELWINDQLERYNKPIDIGHIIYQKGFMHIPDGIDEELPFS